MTSRIIKTVVCAMLISTLAWSSKATVKYMPYGINFSPYIGTQDPNKNVILKPAQVTARLNTIKGSAEWVRTYSVTHGMETAGALAHKAGFKVALGAWLGPETNTNQSSANSNEIVNLVAAANRGEADMLVIGSEVLLRGDLPVETLTAYLDYVRHEIKKDIPITTADTYRTLIANPTVIQKCDVVFANFYPYWDDIRIDCAIASLDRGYSALVTAAGGKDVVVSETGWPSAGTRPGNAVASVANAAYYELAFESWAKDKNIKTFYFEAYDEQWKVQAEGSFGGSWGIRNNAGVLKTGMNWAYLGYKLPAAIYMRDAGDVPKSEPKIQITNLAAYGSGGGLSGIATGVDPKQYKVATYINVAGSWWTKPYYNDPTVALGLDGKFAVNFVTGGNDSKAIEVKAALIPASYDPLGASGGSIPDEVYTYAVATCTVERPQGTPAQQIKPIGLDCSTFTINRTFATTPKALDDIAVVGTITFPTAVNILGANTSILVGGTTWKLSPLSKVGTGTVTAGPVPGASGSITVTKNGMRWTFSARMKCNGGGSYWDDEGLINTTINAPGVPVYTWVTVIVNGTSYSQNIGRYYTATQNKLGVMK